MATVDQELLFAIRGIEVLLESGVGVAEAMKHVAEEDYGDLSGIFQQIFKDTDGGKNFSDAIRTQMRKTDSAGLRKVLSSLIMSIEEDTNVIDRLRSIADKEARERRVNLDNFIEGLTATSEQFLIVSILIPIIVVIGAVVNGLGLQELKIGKEIAHGVPALWSPNSNCNKPVSVTLKSGNFGQADFFKRALQILRGKT